MEQTAHVVVVPRWSGRPDDDWYPWLARTLPAGTVTIANLPEPDEPQLALWVAELTRLVAAEAVTLARTVLVGHSVGCMAILHALAALPPGSQVAGVLCVAGWWTIDQPWPSIRPWLTAPLDLTRVRTAAPTVRVLLSDNDPYTADVATNRLLWEERLGAQVRVIPGAAHFNRAVEPAIRNELRTWRAPDH